MEILLQDIKRVLGAKRIYLPGSAEEATHLSRVRSAANGRIIESVPQDSELADLESRVEGLGIVDPTTSGATRSFLPHTNPNMNTNIASSPPGIGPSSGTSRRSSAPRRSHPVSVAVVPDLSPLVTGVSTVMVEANPDKENMPIVRGSRVMRVKEGTLQLEAGGLHVPVTKGGYASGTLDLGDRKSVV